MSEPGFALFFAQRPDLDNLPISLPEMSLSTR